MLLDVETSRHLVRIAGSQWDVVLASNPVKLAELTQGELAAALQVPLHYIVIRQLSIGSLLIEFDVVQNESARISSIGIDDLVSDAPIAALAIMYSDVTGLNEDIHVISSVTTVANAETGRGACSKACVAGIIAAASAVAVALVATCICWKLHCCRQQTKGSEADAQEEVGERHEPVSHPPRHRLPAPTDPAHHHSTNTMSMFDPLPGIIMPPQALTFAPPRSISTGDSLDDKHHRIHVVSSTIPASPSKVSEFGSLRWYRTGSKLPPPPTESSVITADLLDWDVIESVRGMSVDHTVSGVRQGIETPIKHHLYSTVDERQGSTTTPAAVAPTALRARHQHEAFDHVVGKGRRGGPAEWPMSPRHAVVTVFDKDSSDDEAVGARGWQHRTRFDVEDSEQPFRRSISSSSERSSLWEWEFEELPQEPAEARPAAFAAACREAESLQRLRPVPPLTRGQRPSTPRGDAPAVSRNPFADFEVES